MIYYGHIQNGRIELEGAERLPEGAKVRVDVIEPAATTNGTPPSTSRTVWDDLLALAGTVPGLPEDFSQQHDHYLYGTPKR